MSRHLADAPPKSTKVRVIAEHLAELRREGTAAMTRGVRTMIDLDRARQLRREHWTWPAIGKQLAIERGRRVPYQGRSVDPVHANRRAERAKGTSAMTVLVNQRVQCDRCRTVIVLQGNKSEHWGEELHGWRSKRPAPGGVYRHACRLCAGELLDARGERERVL